MGNQQNEYQFKPYTEHPKILVRSDGKLFNSVSGKEWYSRLNKDGYIYFQYKKDDKVRTRKLHKAVAEAFVEIPDDLEYVLETHKANSLVVKHKDNNKLNNHPSNLAWDTLAGNTRDAHKDGIVPALIGTAHGMCKMTEDQVRQVCDIYFVQKHQGKPPSSKATAELLGLTFKQVVKIRGRETWKHITCQYVDILPNDYPAREYTQVSGNAEPSSGGEDIV